MIRDVANYTEHEDPQLRGSVALLLGQVVYGALTESGGDLDLWYNNRRPNHLDTLNILQVNFIHILSRKTLAIVYKYIVFDVKKKLN